MVSYPAPWPPYRAAPAPPVRRRKVGAPIGVIIALGSVTGLIVALLTAVNPIATAIGLALSSVAMTVVVLAYLWLDRWEPEPRRLLVFAFLWGASVAVVVSTVLELTLEFLTRTEASFGFASTAIVAPLVEEAAKGAFLLLMMTGRRRDEMNSLTDCLVYAGLVGAGFAWLEDIVYIGGGASVSESVLTAAMRLIMAPFAHPLFTTMIGLGAYFALRERSAAAKACFLVLGYLAAVIMHGLWNGSSLLGADAYFLVYLFWMVPVFALAITLGVVNRRREQRIVAATLPGMAAAGVIMPGEALWLGTMAARKAAVAEANRLGGRAAGKQVRRFAAQVVKLAFVRDRIERGFGDQRVFALQTEEAYGVYAARAAAPVLAILAGYRPPRY